MEKNSILFPKTFSSDYRYQLLNYIIETITFMYLLYILLSCIAMGRRPNVLLRIMSIKNQENFRFQSKNLVFIMF